MPLRQLRKRTVPALIYALVLRKRVGEWDFVIIPRGDLFREHARHGLGSPPGTEIRLYLAFHAADVICSGRSFQGYRNNFRLSAYR